MSGDLDPLYVLARKVLLDALEALGEQRRAVILVGAQAVYHHVGEADIAVSPYTEDADLALAPELLLDAPALAEAMQAASFCLFSLWQKTPGYLISSLLFALTAWSIPAVVAAAIGDLLGPEIASAAYGFVTLLFGIGQASAPMIAGRIADATGSFALAFLLAAGVAVGGALLSLFFLPRKTQNQTESSG